MIIGSVWEGNMRLMMKRHVLIFKKLTYLGYLEYPIYPRYPSDPKYSGGILGTPCKDTKSLRKNVKGYVGSESKKDRLNTCQKIKNR